MRLSLPTYRHLPLTLRSVLGAVLLLAVAGSTATLGAQRINRIGGAPPATTPELGVIDGAVSDTSLRPVAFAEVSILRTDIKLTTNSSGRFRFVDVPAGQYLLIVRRLGYRPISAIVEVAAADTLRLSYSMEPATRMLDSVVVSASTMSLRMVEFEKRRREGVGFFITEEQIDRRNLPVSADYLRLAPSVTLTPTHNASGISELVAISRREGGSLFGEGAGACAMQVLVDGVPMPRRFPLELLPTPKDIAGIEIYAGAASVPAQFDGADRRCGMIIVWTRDGRDDRKGLR